MVVSLAKRRDVFHSKKRTPNKRNKIKSLQKKITQTTPNETQIGKLKEVQELRRTTTENDLNL